MFPEEPYVVNEAGPDEPWVRRYFVRRVFGIVSLQLAILALFVYVAFSESELRTMYREDEDMDIGCTLWFGVMMLLIVFAQRLRRGCAGITLLVLQTLFFCNIATYYALDCSEWTLLLAASSTAIIMLTFICISACTNLDITKYHAFVVVFLFIGIGCVVILYALKKIKPDIREIELSLGIIGSLVLSVLLLYDVQTIVGGSRAIVVNSMYSIYAAAQLYAAIGFLFVCLLMLKLV